MKLLFLCPYYPPHVGGVENYAFQLNEWLAKEPTVSSITVLAPRLPVDATLSEKNGKITILRYPAFEPVSNFPIPKFWHKSYRELIAQAKRSQPTIVFSYTRFFVSSLVAYRISRQLKTKWIHVEHGSDFVQSSSRLVSGVSWLYDQTFGRLVLKKADRVIGISNAVARFVKTIVPRDVRVIYRGVDQGLIEMTSINEKIRASYQGKIIVNYLGRLIVGKGLLDLIEAAKLLSNKKVIFLMVGAGPQEKELKTAVEQVGLGKQIVFLGSKPFVEAIGIMKASDIVINPSYTEGLPTTLIEAALCSKAIIATDVGGTNEIVTDGVSGRLIAPHQPKQIAQALASLLADGSEREKMGELVYQAAKKRFDWKINAHTFLVFCQQTLAS